MTDLVYLIVGLVVTAVLSGILFVVRRGVRSQRWKDFLGISIAFVVLAFVGWGMMVGEHFGG